METITLIGYTGLRKFNGISAAEPAAEFRVVDVNDYYIIFLLVVWINILSL